MISVVIPTCDDERALFATLSALVPAAADGLVREVVVVDGGSRDGTARIADLTGCRWIDGPERRAQRLEIGAEAARGPWLLFLLPGAAPEEGWSRILREALTSADEEPGRHALHFRAVRAHAGMAGRLAGAGAALRALATGAAALDHGLVIHRDLYRVVGGVRPLPALEIADLARRVGRRRRRRVAVRLLVEPAPTGRRAGRVRRALGAGLLALRMPTRMAARLYA
jgi:glycosyltransferase involved in cell wall biosynthesis